MERAGFKNLPYSVAKAYSTHTLRIFCIYNTIDYRLKHSHHRDIFPALFSTQYGFCTVGNYSYFHSHMPTLAVHYNYVEHKYKRNLAAQNEKIQMKILTYF